MSENPFKVPEIVDEEPTANQQVSGSSKAKSASFLSHAAIYGIGSIALQLVSLILLPLYTWKLEPSEFGVLQLLYRVGDVINIVLMVNGIQLAVLNFWGKAENEQQRRFIAPTVVTFTVCFLIAGSLVVMLASGYLATFLAVGDWRLLACGIIAIMLQATTVLPMALMQARIQSTAYVAAAFSIAAGQLILVSLALTVLDAGIWGVVIAFAANNLIFGVLLNVRELAQSSWRPDARQMWDLVKFAFPLAPSGFFLFILHNGDQFFLVRHHSTYVLGIYALAYKISKSVVYFAAQPLCQVWNAWMYDIYKQDNRADTFGKSVTRIMAVIAFAGSLLVIFKYEIFGLLGGGKYAAAAEVVGPLVLANAVLILANLMDSSFYVTRRTDLKPFISGASSIFILAAYWLLIPRYAAMGAALATLVGFLFHFALTLLVSRKVFTIHIETKRMVAMILISMVICAVAEWLGPGTRVLPLKLALAFAWPALVAGVGLVSRDEREYVQNAIRQAQARLF